MSRRSSTTALTRSIALAGFALVGCLALAPPAMACLNTPASAHFHEMHLVNQGLETLKRDPAVVEQVNTLRDSADAAFKAHAFKKAADDRHAALAALGYKVGKADPGSERRPRSMPHAAEPPSGVYPGCGAANGLVWVSPDA
jgi:hypothetical protein